MIDAMGRFVDRHRRFWLWLGRLESALLGHELQAVRLRGPIYVCGLARSGSTLLHEILASHPDVGSHRIKDYPMLFTPYWWRRATAFIHSAPPKERVHRDKILVSPDSPDAVEEMLWMAFFPRCHDPSVDNRLGPDRRHAAFESFYRNHIGKLLLAERATRYAAKANYHVARLAYLLRIFPDAKFIIPVRGPAAHIASLVRQHAWFSAGHRSQPSSLASMRRSGHFEFGLDRRPMNLGDGRRVAEIRDAWGRGEEVRGWALYWDMVHSYLADLLSSDARIRKASLIVRFETMCNHPMETLGAVLEHCDLPDRNPIIERFAPTIRHPDYYENPFSPAELEIIREHTASAARRWGYESYSARDGH